MSTPAFEPSDEQLRFWTRVRRAFNPLYRTTPEAIPHIYQARPNSPASELQRALLLAAAPVESSECVRCVLVGARGSGKSTELARLHAQLQGQLCIVPFDVEKALPPGSGTLAVIALMGILASASCEVWSSAEDQDMAIALAPRRNAFQEAVGRFGWVSEQVGKVTTLCAEVFRLMQPVADLPPDTADTLKLAGEATKQFGNFVQDLLARHPLQSKAYDRSDAQTLIASVNGLLEQLRELAGKPTLFLLDGLDRMTALDDARAAFQDVDLLRDVLTHLILTGPLAIRHEPALRNVAHEIRTLILNNVPIRQSAPSHPLDPDGIALLKAIFHDRCAAFDLPSSGFIDDEALEHAALMSAGLVRDFISLIHDASKDAAFLPEQRIAASTMERVIGVERRQRQDALRTEDILLLHNVLTTRSVRESARADTLLFENFIVCYANGDSWFRPHEQLVDFIAHHPAVPAP